MNESTIVELCYLLTIDMGVKVSYIIKWESPEFGPRVEVIHLRIGVVLINVYWNLEDDLTNKMVVMSSHFNETRWIICDHIKAFHL